MRRELALLGERLSRATGEAAQLRGERDELHTQIRELDVIVRNNGEAHTSIRMFMHMHADADPRQPLPCGPEVLVVVAVCKGGGAVCRAAHDVQSTGLGYKRRACAGALRLNDSRGYGRHAE